MMVAYNIFFILKKKMLYVHKNALRKTIFIFGILFYILILFTKFYSVIMCDKKKLSVITLRKKKKNYGFGVYTYKIIKYKL